MWACKEAFCLGWSWDCLEATIITTITTPFPAREREREHPELGWGPGAAWGWGPGGAWLVLVGAAWNGIEAAWKALGIVWRGLNIYIYILTYAYVYIYVYI